MSPHARNHQKCLFFDLQISSSRRSNYRHLLRRQLLYPSLSYQYKQTGIENKLSTPRHTNVNELIWPQYKILGSGYYKNFIKQPVTYEWNLLYVDRMILIKGYYDMERLLLYTPTIRYSTCFTQYKHVYN